MSVTDSWRWLNVTRLNGGDQDGEIDKWDAVFVSPRIVLHVAFIFAVVSLLFFALSNVR